MTASVSEPLIRNVWLNPFLLSRFSPAVLGAAWSNLQELS